MAFDFMSAVTGMRRVVHKTLGTIGYYEDPAIPGLVELRVRWHTRVAVGGDLGDAGYAQLIDGINRLIFDREELQEKGIALDTGGRITFAHPSLEGVALLLGEQEPANGPINEIWQVAQE